VKAVPQLKSSVQKSVDAPPTQKVSKANNCIFGFNWNYSLCVQKCSKLGRRAYFLGEIRILLLSYLQLENTLDKY
jgi:hypothetical protein